MANPISSLESHPQRDRIVDAIVAGRSLNEIVKWASPAVTAMALSRYKRKALAVTQRHISQAQTAILNNDNGLTEVDAKAVMRATLAASVDPFIARALAQDRRRASWMDDLEQQPEAVDYRTLAALDRNDIAAQEYHAKLAGRLQDASSTTQVMIVCPAPTGTTGEPGSASAPGDRHDVVIDIGVSPRR